MACTRRIRALVVAMRNMGPQEGITQQISNVHLGRTCAAALVAFPAEEAHYEAMKIFDRQDEMETTAWRIKIQDDQDLRVARMVDLYDDLHDPFDPL
jgi:hypothetical protein